jgi:hypothetical protein
VGGWLGILSRPRQHAKRGVEGVSVLCDMNGLVGLGAS